MKVRLIIVLVFVTQISWAQQSAKYSYSLGGEVFEGFIIKHHEYLGHLIKGRPAGFEISFKQQTNGTKSWEANYGYPEIAYNLSYYDLKNDDQLGRVVALSAGMGFHLLGKPPFTSDFQFYFGMGLAYSNNPYNKENNNLNNVISSPITYNGNLRLTYYHSFGKRIRVGAGLKFTHFSNGSFKLPNNGLNIFTANVMASYKLTTSTTEFKTDKKNYTLDKKVKYGAVFRLGFAESPPIGSGVKPVYGFSLIAQKRVSLKSMVEVGLEGFANLSIKSEIENSFDEDIKGTDYKRAGIMVGHQLLVNKLTVITQVGLYIYKPYYPNN
ncbi:MAG: acyloxyacyl hydrolase, partial [Cyclobacteriaceae bacterium]|nr:acyloxyacyl hydrolase [Cyclobacteriaceae bacterium]